MYRRISTWLSEWVLSICRWRLQRWIPRTVKQSRPYSTRSGQGSTGDCSFPPARPGLVLAAESAGAALLVVGTKEHVGIGRLVRGSVSHYSLSHARCPVVAVPAVRDHDADKGLLAERFGTIDPAISGTS
jgi:hypothetical protein